MQCSKCGFEIDSTKNFCGKCGFLIPKLTQPSSREIEKESQLVSQKENIASCPRCGSTSIQYIKQGFKLGRGLVGAVALGPIGAAAGLIGSNKGSLICLKCKTKF